MDKNVQDCDICVVGHLTNDTVETLGERTALPGGTAYYTTMALSQLKVSRLVVFTTVSEDCIEPPEALRRKGVEVHVKSSAVTTSIVNQYDEIRPDHRIQTVTAVAERMNRSDLAGIRARVFHLGPLTSNDLDLGLIRNLSKIGSVSLDIQGLLRHVVGTEIVVKDWRDKRSYLPFVSVLKASEAEARLLTGTGNMYTAARRIADWGVPEVIVTLGRRGSVVLHRGNLRRIPAYQPASEVDPTGCGDTYMAGYLYKRLKGSDCGAAGKFGSVMAACKLGYYGPFRSNASDLLQVSSHPRHLPPVAA